MQTTPVFLPGKSNGQKSLVGYSPRDHQRFGHNLVTKQQQQDIYKKNNSNSEKTNNLKSSVLGCQVILINSEILLRKKVSKLRILQVANTFVIF